PFEPPAERRDVLDAVEAPLAARRRAVAERAGERAAARRHDARHGRRAVVEDVRLEAEREIGNEVPRRLGEAGGLVSLQVGRARWGARRRSRGTAGGPPPAARRWRGAKYARPPSPTMP